jgi:parallel beta-helix repeat protein
VHDNHGPFAGILAFPGDNCLITMNTSNSNAGFGIATIEGNRCTVSLNTASNNGRGGIDVAATFSGGTGHLVTWNVALNNGGFDFAVNCPSNVTNNDSTNGFPTSYDLIGTGCNTVNND